MNILHINKSDNYGGAARAAYSLHRELINAGINSKMLVQLKYTRDTSVATLVNSTTLSKIISKFSSTLDSLPLRLYKEKRPFFNLSPGLSPNPILRKKIHQLSPNIVHLHWITGGFVPISEVPKLSAPIVWTLHDMWPFTGGCHYAGGCTQYLASCGKCPQLGSNKEFDLSRKVWKQKHELWAHKDLTIVSISTWLADCAKSSSLLQDSRIEIIPNGLNLALYKPSDKFAARKRWSLPLDKKLVLFGTAVKMNILQKGFRYLYQALQYLMSSDWRDKVELVVFGPPNSLNYSKMGIKVHHVGYLMDDASLVSLYSAADVMVSSSVQEAFGLTLIEAMSCGTPTVAFANAGPLDIIDHKKNGYLAEPFSSVDLADGISWVLENQSLQSPLSLKARARMEETFDISKVSRQYADLYQEISE
ncbi:MAG: glycosyltransferase family 4 protein [Candidatus Heimdallarchaeota archaeon]